MRIADQTQYKASIKVRLMELQQLRPGLTLKKLATQIPIQYTYLSKALNDSSTHLNEDDLFRLGQLLEFFPQEIEFLLLLREHETATLPARREFAYHKLEKARKALGVRADVRESDILQVSQEMGYLLDPFCVLVHVALHIPAIRKDPRSLCAHLGISQARLKEILKKLSLVDFIEMDTGPFSVKKVNRGKLHYPKEHPLMRVHQNLFKMASQDQLLKTAEEQKESFQVTFTADAAAFEKIRAEFQDFVRKVEETVRPTKPERLLQLGFDLFFWV